MEVWEMDIKMVAQVEALLCKAGDAIMEVYASDSFGTRQKSDFSPVTRADRISSRIINEGLSRIFPSIPVIDEENTLPPYETRQQWETFFLLDPLDGTREFIQRNGEFCINLALMNRNLPVASWIYQPVKRIGWFCSKSKGILNFGGSPVVRHRENFEKEKLRIVTSRSHPSDAGNELMRRLGERYNLEIVRLGSALKQVEVALGSAGLYLRGSGCSEWDTAAGQLMIEESGGIVLKWDMITPLVYNKPVLKNPPFVMISREWQCSEFKDFIRNILPDRSRY